MARPDLVKVEVAAEELGVPKSALRAAAQRLGKLVMMGRAVRIDRNSYEEIVKGCQGNPQEQGSISAPIMASSTSVIPAAQTVQPALEAARMLKGRSRPTSTQRAR
jgi:hypothetical protein